MAKEKNVSNFVPLYSTNLFLMRKNKILLLLVGCFALLMSSCLGSNDTVTELGKDCEILTFTLASDSVEGLSSAVFTIDQLNGRIYNTDSLPYGTTLKNKVKCTVRLASTVAVCQVLQHATGDTIAWNTTDSLDFSKPVEFKNILWDGTTTKTYVAQVNIHQILPDTMVWETYAENLIDEPVKAEKTIVFGNPGAEYYYMYVQPANSTENYRLYRSSVSDGKNWTITSLSGLPAGEVALSQMTEYGSQLYVTTTKGTLYRSSDGQNWTAVSNAPTIKALLGNIKTSTSGTIDEPSALAAIISNNGILEFARMDKSQAWSTGNAIDNTFPISGFANTNYVSNFRNRLIIAGGRDKSGNLLNSTWSTSDGLSWAQLTDDASKNLFEKQEGASIIQYDGKLFMISGIMEGDTASSRIYWSQDGGVSWSVSDTMAVMPGTFKPRGFTSIYVDQNKFMYLFGGKETNKSNVLDQIWRGRINYLGFKDDE